jgi:rhodanese-related sulfurtransferase
MRSIDACTAKRLAHSDSEIAFLDVREHGLYGEGHPLFAVWCPYSRLELLAPSLVPNPSVPVVLIDADDGVALRAAARLEPLGYGNVSVVDGGVHGWTRAGFTLFEGEHVPSKTLGELAERVFHPATIDAATLAEWQTEKRPHALFDVRPPAEHSKMTLPGARCVPNGELPHRLAAVTGDESIPIVLTCAGRTRSLIGAASLKLLGIDNPVYGLENGTQGWALAGFDLDRGRTPGELPILSDAEIEISRNRARTFANRWKIPWITPANARELTEDRSRTTYVFDVRSEAEFSGGHLPGAEHAPCVQIVQATDRWIGVRRARVVLTDDTGLRATIAAFWLKQLGYETYVLPCANGPTLPDWSIPVRVPPARIDPLPRIMPAEAANRIARNEASLLDLRSSVERMRERPAGSRWAIRPELAAALDGLRKQEFLRSFLVADNENIAGLAAVDLREMGVEDIRIVDGGLPSWKAAGLATEAGNSKAASHGIDFLAFVHDRHEGNLDAARRYLTWETGLVHRLDEEERAAFLLTS